MTTTAKTFAIVAAALTLAGCVHSYTVPVDSAYTAPATSIVLIDARPESEKTPKTEFYDYPGF